MKDFAPPYGEIEVISPNIRRITAYNPAPFTFEGTGTYIVGHGNVAIIDPGPNLPKHIDAILNGLKEDAISHILVTHNHQDHSPAAIPLSKKCGAKIYAANVDDQMYSDHKIEEGIDEVSASELFLILKALNMPIESFFENLALKYICIYSFLILTIN